MKKILLIVYLTIITGSLFAQHTVSGIITDRKDKSLLLREVQVYIPELNRTEFSKEGGTYILRNIGIGTVHIQFSKRGYQTVYKIISTIDSATVISIEMDPDGNQPEEYVVSNPFITLPGKFSYNTTVISSRKLNRMGNSTFLQSLAYIPGIDNYSMGNIRKPMIRGLSFNNILMIQNGSRIENHSWNELSNYGIVEEGTESVEIVKGTAAVIYGNNSAGGVLIFRDEKSPAAGTIVGDVNLGFFNNTVGLNMDAGVKGAGQNGLIYSFRLGGKSHTSFIQGEGDKVRKNTEVKDFAYNSGVNSESAKGMIGISKKWGQSRLTLSYRNTESEIIRSMSDSAIEVLQTNIERERETATPYTEQSSLLVSSENVVLLKKSQLNMNFSFQSAEQKTDPNDSLILDDYYLIALKLSTFNYDLKYVSNAALKYGITAGIQGYFQQDKIYLYENDISTIGAYALARYDLEKVNFLAGLRFDAGNVTSNYEPAKRKNNIASGSAGLAWHPRDDMAIKLNAASGYVIPSAEQLNELITVNSFSGIVQGNPDLNEEKNYEGDLGFTWNGTNISVGINGYYNMINNYIYTESKGSDSVYQNHLYKYEQADASINGGELFFDIHPEKLKWLTLNASFSTVKGEFKDSSFNLPTMPADKIVTSLRFQSEKMNYMYRSYVSLTMRNYLKQDRVYSYETTTDGYTLLDLHLGASFIWGQQNFDVSISVNNIIDTGFNSSVSPLKYMEPVAVREMGRNISLTFHVPFGIKK